MSRARIGPVVMDRLSRYVGQRVTVEYASRFGPNSTNRILKWAYPFTGIYLSKLNLGFVNWHEAIKKITSQDGVVIYENTLVGDSYHPTAEEIKELRSQTFGRWAKP